MSLTIRYNSDMRVDLSLVPVFKRLGTKSNYNFNRPLPKSLKNEVAVSNRDDIGGKSSLIVNNDCVFCGSGRVNKRCLQFDMGYEYTCIVCKNQWYRNEPINVPKSKSVLRFEDI